MGKIVIFNEREVKGKGKNKEDEINKERWKSYFLGDNYNNLKLIDKIPPFSIGGKINWFYPGCGVDVLYPLVYLERLFPKVKKVDFIFVDMENNLKIIKTTLDNVGVSFSEIKGGISFYWKGKEIALHFFEMEVENVLKQDFGYNVYFEKGFRIMKDRINDYEEKVFGKLVRGGVLISDNGFKDFGLKIIKVPDELSAYEEMMVGIKK